MLNQRKHYFRLRHIFYHSPKVLAYEQNYAYLWTFVYRLTIATIMLYNNHPFQWHITIFNLCPFEVGWKLVDLNWSWLGWFYSSSWVSHLRGDSRLVWKCSHNKAENKRISPIIWALSKPWEDHVHDIPLPKVNCRPSQKSRGAHDACG